jgi:hypothetical protein
MPGIQRFQDANSGGGIITFIPQTSVFANSKNVAVFGSRGTSHPPCDEPPIHCEGAWQTLITIGTNVFAEGIPVNKTGDIDSCGHARVGGSTNVFVHGN